MNVLAVSWKFKKVFVACNELLRIFPLNDLGQVINEEIKTTEVVASGEKINQIKVCSFKEDDFLVSLDNEA